MDKLSVEDRAKDGEEIPMRAIMMMMMRKTNDDEEVFRLTDDEKEHRKSQ